MGFRTASGVLGLRFSHQNHATDPSVLVLVGGGERVVMVVGGGCGGDGGGGEMTLTIVPCRIPCPGICQI